MKKFILILCLFIISTDISAQSSTVTVEGKAGVSVTPDQAILNLGVEMEGRNLSAMIKRIAEATNTFLRLTDHMSSSLAEQSYSVGQIRFNQSVLATFEIEN